MLQLSELPFPLAYPWGFVIFYLLGGLFASPQDTEREFPAPDLLMDKTHITRLSSVQYQKQMFCQERIHFSGDFNGQRMLPV